MLPKIAFGPLLDFPFINKHNKLIFVLYSSGILSCIFLLTKDTIAQNYYSCLVETIVLLGLLVATYLYFKKNMFFYAHLLATVTAAFGISFASVFEGLISGKFIFFMPLMFVIPYVISRNQHYKKLVYIFYPIIGFFILLTLTLSPVYPYLQEITTEELQYSAILNICISFFLVMVFSIVFVFVETRYISAIQGKKRLAIEERNARTAILSNLGHELRTQINSINGTTQMILEESPEWDSKNHKNFVKYTETLKYCNDQMLVLVNDILDLHKIETKGIELSPVKSDINELVHKVFLPYKNTHGKSKNILIVKNIDVVLAGKSVLLDGSRLTQVLHNLLSNAFKFTEFGKVELTVKCLEENDSNCKVLFSVRDTGIGISQENLEKVFKSFVQVNNPDYRPLYSGTGLGLSIAQSIIGQMGGKIELESQPNMGSHFFFTLNLAKTSTKSSELTIESEDGDYDFLQGRNILVADDNPISLLYAQKLLEKHKVQVSKAKNGIEAVDAVKWNNNLDLVLLDLEMPIMTGFEAIAKIKRIDPSLKVVAFTANIPGDMLKKRLEGLGFDSIISKPFEKGKAMGVLKSCLSSENLTALDVEPPLLHPQFQVV